MQVQVYQFKRQGSQSLVIASLRKPKEVRKHFRRAGYEEVVLQRNKHGIPIVGRNVRMIRQDIGQTSGK